MPGQRAERAARRVKAAKAIRIGLTGTVAGWEIRTVDFTESIPVHVID